MRVGLLIYGSLETLSGGYLYDRKLTAHLRSQGDSVEIVSLPWRSYPRHLLDNFSVALLRRLRTLQVNVLIQDELNHPSLAWLNGRARPAYPVVSLVHHLRCDELRPAWQNRVYRRVERRYLNSVDGFIFNSDTTRQAVEAISELDGRPWVIATPAGDRFDPQMDAAQIEGRAALPGPLRLIFLGNWIPRKGLHTLLETLSRLPEGCCTLDVVGNSQVDPAYSRAIFRQAEQRSLTSVVRFHGIQEDEALANLLRQSHVLAVPSSFEGFGIVYLEGMSFGLPAIGTRRGAAAEIIRPGENGFLIEPGDSAGLAALLENLRQDRERLASLSLAALRTSAQFPGWEQSMAGVRAFLSKIVEQPGN